MLFYIEEVGGETENARGSKRARKRESKEKVSNRFKYYAFHMEIRKETT